MATIAKRGDSYRIKVSCGYDNSGKQVIQLMTWKPEPSMTAKQVEKELTRQTVLFEEACLKGQVVSSVKFETFAEQWFEEYARRNLKNTSLDRMMRLRVKVYAAIGHLRLDKITARHIQKFVTALANTKSEATGRVYARKTVVHHLSFISTVFGYAVKMGIAKEIHDCSEEEIETMAKIFDTGSSLAVARLFADFLRYAKLTKWGYDFHPRGKKDSPAYPLKDFAAMAYCVFNDEMWEKHDLVSKAVKSQKFADIWLLTALHLVCALRRTDMLRIPAPSLPYEPDRVLKEIEAGTFPEYEVLALADELEIRVASKEMKPTKTAAYENIPNLKLFIPESLRKPMGIIIAVALAHRPEIEPGDPFVSEVSNMMTFRKFFGREFAESAGGGKHFSVRRCNKSYLQGIGSIECAEDAPGKPKGYILAALARSHKGGIGKLPEITDIYLKDANFTGYSPEFIAREMFERGVLSFIPAVMLEIYAGKEFKRLSVSSQTLMIRQVGLTPGNIENLVCAAESALHNAQETVNAAIRDGNMRREHIGAALQNIASGNAPSRVDICLCLMTALGRKCPYPERAGCIGCGYEIYTKSAVHLLMREFARLKNQRETAETGEAWRYSAMMERAVMPAVAEIIACVKMFAPGADIETLLDIVERGIEGNDRVIREK